MAGGRPTDYRPEYVKQVLKLARLGATDEEIADFFGCSVATLHNWRAAHPEFLEAGKTGKLQADLNVADRLYQRAIGYSHPEEKIFCSDGEVTRARTTKHYAPDVTAGIFWLKNRRPAEWRERIEHNHTGNISVTTTSYARLPEPKVIEGEAETVG